MSKQNIKSTRRSGPDEEKEKMAATFVADRCSITIYLC